MKKIISLILLTVILAMSLTLGGCGFIEEDTGMMIKEIKKTNEFEDGTSELTISFTDDYYKPVKITIPPGKQGETGNGIANILYEYDDDGKQTHLTIEYTEEGIDPVKFDIPDGKTVTSITTDFDALTEKYYANFIFNGNPEDYVQMELPEFSGIKKYDCVTNDDQSVDITFTFNIIDEPLRIHVPAPQKGNGIENITSYESEDGLYYCLDITYTDPGTEVQHVTFAKPADPNQWTASYSSYDTAEDPKVGDYWFNMTAKTIHVFRGDKWELVIAFNDQSTTHEVQFFLNNGVNTSVYTQAYVNHGNYFSSTGRDIPVPPDRDGYKFDGWYTKAEGVDLRINAPFTDLTPVNGNLNLYARWIEIE